MAGGQSRPNDSAAPAPWRKPLNFRVTGDIYIVRQGPIALLIDFGVGGNFRMLPWFIGHALFVDGLCKYEDKALPVAERATRSTTD